MKPGRGADGDASGADGDASGADGDASGTDGDASGGHRARRASHREARRPRAPTTKKSRVSKRTIDPDAARGEVSDRRARRAAKGRRALLDSAPILPSPQAPSEGEGAPWELVSRLWRALLASRGASLSLVSLSLTMPPGRDVRTAAAFLAPWIEARPGEGGLLVVDRAPCGGAAHLHGLALVHDAAALGEHWRTLTDAGPACVRLNPVTGWSEHVRGASGGLLPNVARVLGYAFRPWPAQHGQRSLDTDVCASGVFAGPWAGARAAARSTHDVNPGAHVCGWCRSAMPLGKRRDARWCCPSCRKHASRASGTLKRPA
jgi:hypothetical protein